MPTVTIAHLADPHLDGTEDGRDRVGRVARFLATLDPGPDVVVVSGDLTQRPPGAEEDAAAEVVAGELAFLEATLSRAVPAPVLLVPGNSDDRAVFAEHLDRGQATGRALRVVDAEAGQANRAVDAAGLRFLLVDSSVPGEFAGELEEGTVHWLATQLDAATTPVVLVLHHPPVDLGHPVVDTLRLRRPERLQALLQLSPNLVGTLAGHTHAATATTFAGRPLVVAPGVHSLGQLPWLSDGTTAGLIDPTAAPGLALHGVDPESRDLVSYFVLV